MPKFTITETIHSERVLSTRLGSNTVALGGGYTDKEAGKAVKLTAESRFVLSAAGDPIEAIISSVSLGVYDGFSIGGVVSRGYKEVTFDGLEATLGVGVVALGNIVVTGTVAPAGTALTAPLKVTRATNQPGVAIVAADNLIASINAALVSVADANANAQFAWKVVSLGSVGTGAVGTTGVIERV